MDFAVSAQLLGPYGHIRNNGFPDAKESSVLHLAIPTCAFERQVCSMFDCQHVRHSDDVYYLHLLLVGQQVLVLAVPGYDYPRDSELCNYFAFHSWITEMAADQQQEVTSNSIVQPHSKV